LLLPGSHGIAHQIPLFRTGGNRTAAITRQLNNAGIANLEMKTDQKTLPYAVLAGVAVFILVVLLLLLL
jgi:hypothetical protein